MEHLIRPNYDSSILMEVTPTSAQWDYLSFKVISLKAGQRHTEHTEENEVALVPLSGQGSLAVGEAQFSVARQGVFTEMSHVLYVPPRHTVEVTAAEDFEFAIGGAPAEGKYPLRLITPAEIRSEVRGGGAATRQVCHTLGPSIAR